MKHNETCNIWTHLMAFIYFLVLAILIAYEEIKLPYNDEKIDTRFVNKWAVVI